MVAAGRGMLLGVGGCSHAGLGQKSPLCWHQGTLGCVPLVHRGQSSKAIL